MVGGHTLESDIKLRGAYHPFDPGREVAYHALVDLAEDIGGDGRMEVGVWEIAPKGFKDGRDTVLVEELVKHTPRLL